jgi:hypothetical protein
LIGVLMTRILLDVALRCKGGSERFPDPAQISPETVVLEILQVEPDLVGEDDLVVVPDRIRLSGQDLFLVRVLDRRRPGDPRPQVQDPPRLALEPVAVPRDVRPRPDQAHLADQDVPELGVLVDLEPAHNAPHACDPAIPPYRHRRGIAVPGAHRPELAHREELPFPSHPSLPEQRRPARRCSDQDGDDPHRQSQYDKSYGRGREIEHAFAEAPVHP